MPTLSGTALKRRLERREFSDLFVEELGWDRLRGVADQRFEVDGQAVRLEGVVQKRDVPVYLHKSPALPDRDRRRRIERALSGRQLEHLIVFLGEGDGAQVWQWVKREPNRPERVREHAWRPGEQVEALRQKLDALQFTLEEEEAGRIEVTEVTNRLKRAFDADRITRGFYTEFKAQHDALLAFLKALPEDVRSWYASVTLNRLMFVYFIQKKGFIDGRTDYLNEQLGHSKTELGKDKFFTGVLGPLFFRGFALPQAERTAADKALLGKVPYLNGGLFQQHQIERDHGDKIVLPDKAFEALFAFFDNWRWHLDERDAGADAAGLTAAQARAGQGREINPDVLGYIFEKYVNQKQMGAYYTKEDITEYICSNTILPRLLDKVKAHVPVAFKGEASIWRLLRDAPDRYIWPSVRHGMDQSLPEAIEAGVDDVAQRLSWDRPASRDLGLPTETWRETMHRRERCVALRAKLAAGEIASPDAMVTANLDIARFVQDAIQQASEDQLKAWWSALNSLTVLDPACGSGAFLFAALGLLEPLYTKVFEAMQTTLADARRAADHSSRAFEKGRWKPFTDVLDEAARHANPAYFVLRSIALNNLYGVDIMEEAAEICKLRLFLKLVAQLDDAGKIEPLPDLDFNIRSGNSLVGFASRAQLDAAVGGQLDFAGAADGIEEEAEQAALCFRRFKDQQVVGTPDAADLRATKAELERRLDRVADQANRWLADRYGKGPEKPSIYAGWLKGHKPFNWFTEFYDVMHGGGFDAVVGNPPYVRASKLAGEYGVIGYKTERCPDIYAWFLERSAALVRDGGRSGMIVPLSLGFSGDFADLRTLLYNTYPEGWFSHYGRIPSALFNYDVRVRCVIQIGRKYGEAGNQRTTRLHRWNEVARPQLVEGLEYAAFQPAKWGGIVPKIGTPGLMAAFEALAAGKTVASLLERRATKFPLYFKQSAYNWVAFSSEPPPAYNKVGIEIEQSMMGTIYASSESARALLTNLLNSATYFAYWLAVGDDFHLTKGNFESFPRVWPNDENNTLGLARGVQTALLRSLTFKLNAGKRIGNFNTAKCRSVTDLVDDVIADLLGNEVREEIKLYIANTVKTDFDEIPNGLLEEAA